MFETLETADSGDIAAEQAVSELAEALAEIGREAAIQAGVTPAEIEKINATNPDIQLETAGVILGLNQDRNPETLIRTAKDELLTDMSMAVLDVETLSGRIDRDLEPKEIQAMLEGRLTMTVGQYAQLHAAIAQK